MIRNRSARLRKQPGTMYYSQQEWVGFCSYFCTFRHRKTGVSIFMRVQWVYMCGVVWHDDCVQLPAATNIISKNCWQMPSRKIKSFMTIVTNIMIHHIGRYFLLLAISHTPSPINFHNFVMCCVVCFWSVFGHGQEICAEIMLIYLMYTTYL